MPAILASEEAVYEPLQSWNRGSLEGFRTPPPSHPHCPRDKADTIELKSYCLVSNTLPVHTLCLDLLTVYRTLSGFPPLYASKKKKPGARQVAQTVSEVQSDRPSVPTLESRCVSEIQCLGSGGSRVSGACRPDSPSKVRSSGSVKDPASKNKTVIEEGI